MIGREEIKAGSSGAAERKGHKRKHAETGLAGLKEETIECTVEEAAQLVASLHAATESGDRGAMRSDVQKVAELAKCEASIDILVKEGVIETIVPMLSLPVLDGEDSFDDVLKEACTSLSVLANKPEQQRRITNSDAIAGLVALLKRYSAQSPAGGVARRAADALTSLAHENAQIKSQVRNEGGIPPLVTLLESTEKKVQRAAAGALRTLAFKSEENKSQIVEYGALPMLICMLRHDDVSIHYEAVGVIGNLVHSSPHIKKKVLEEGALQPVIGILSSKCPESQREAALLIGQFAAISPEFKVKIAQRGAISPLITMLEKAGPAAREMAAFALGRLAQNSDNQAGIVAQGGLKPLLELLDSRDPSLQHNSAFALYGLADNEDNVADVIREGGVLRLMDGELIEQASKDCVQKTIKRLQDKLKDKVLQQLLYLLHTSSDQKEQQYIATALAHLCSEEDQRKVFAVRRVNEDTTLTCALSVLTEMLALSKLPSLQREGAAALFSLVEKASEVVPTETAPPPPTPHVYLGDEFVNNQKLSDVTFIVEGKHFYAHRIALLASSDAFRAMFDGGYKEKTAQHIEISNIRHDVFEAMMRQIYTGTVEVTLDIAQDLLRAADQYLLEGLKRLCELAISNDLTVENLGDVYELAESFHAPQLGNMCVRYALENYAKIVEARGPEEYAKLMQNMHSQLQEYLDKVLCTSAQNTEVEDRNNS